MREFKGALRICTSAWGAIIAVFHLYTAVFGVYQPRIQRGMHLLFLLPLAFLMYPFGKKSPKDKPTVVDWILAFLSLFPPLYLMIHNHDLNMRMLLVEPALPIEVFLGALNILLLLEAIRRAVVPAMAILISAFLGYLWFAPYLPGIFYSRPLRFSRIIEMNYLITDSGIYGSILGVTATFVAVFVIFGAFMQTTRTGQFFTNLACRLAGTSIGGPAKIVVVSSGLFGSVSGVAAANVYATGFFTIPLMKGLGYRPRFAAAIEASASTGGLILPPIMGAGAFVMAEITNIPYATIALSAALAAVLYYVSLGLRVHFMALRERLKPMRKEELISWKEVLMDLYLLLPIVALVIFLVIGFSPFVAATSSIACIFLLSFLRKETRLWPKKLFEVFALAGRNLIMLGVCCAGAGIVVSVVVYTGLALGVATLITSFSGGFLLPALILVMITSIIIGLGLPCTPAYIIAVTIGGPAMMALGINLLPAHLFVFYFAILGEITPPVCIAAYCAASIAKTPPLSTGFEAARLAFIGYLIPFIFVYNESLLLRGPVVLIIATFLGAIMVSGFFAVGMSRFSIADMKIWQSAIFVVASIGCTAFICSKAFMASTVLQIAIICGVLVLIVLWLIKNNSVTKKMLSDLAAQPAQAPQAAN